MASGDPVVQIIEVLPPATLFAPRSRRAGGSTPVENAPVWLFDTTTIEYLDFLCFLRGYSGGGLTFTLVWSAASATSGTCVFGAAIRRFADDAEDVDAAHTYDYNDHAGATAPSLSGEVSYDTITFTHGADMDSWADGEMAIVRVRRNTGAPDDMAGDAELWLLEGRET